MHGRTNSGDLVMVALYAYSPLDGCSVYWTGAGWDADGRRAALFATDTYAEKAGGKIDLPAGAPGLRYEYRNMI